jgi:hypothetical protein
MDYETEPFIMFIKHLYDYLKNKKKTDQQLLDDFSKKAKNIFTRSAKTLGKAGLNIITSKAIGNENAKQLLSDFSDIFFDELVIKESNETSLYEKFKETLNHITDTLEKPLYIIVDELDRCRPSFALEVLEKIKHIFQVKGLRFILVYNDYILESIIEKTYGVSNGNRYLEKFIQKTIHFDNSRYFHNWFVLELENTKERNPALKEKLQGFENNHHIFTELMHTYSISLRDFQVLFSSLANYHRLPYLSDSGGSKELLTVIAFEVLKMTDNKKFISLKNIVETGGQLDNNIPAHSIVFSLVNSMKCSATTHEINEMFKKYIQNEYY